MELIVFDETCYLAHSGIYESLGQNSHRNYALPSSASAGANANNGGQVLSLNPIQFPTASLRGSSVTVTKELSVEHVSNDTSPNTGLGLCWAACIASIGEYKAGGNLLSALDVYNWALTNGYTGGHLFPLGIPSVELPTLNNLYSLSYSYYPVGMYFETTWSTLEQNRPIYAAISRSGGQHAVVICGAIDDSGTYYYYKLMDPNVGYYVTIEVPYASNTFTYVTSYGYTYTSWDYRLS